MRRYGFLVGILLVLVVMAVFSMGAYVVDVGKDWRIKGAFLENCAINVTAEYDVTGGDSGTIAAHDLGVLLPDNAVIVRAAIEVITGFDSVAHGETVSLGVASDDTAGILALSDLGSTGFTASVQDDGLAANYSEKTTAARQLIATVAGETATAGKLLLWVEYIISE